MKLMRLKELGCNTSISMTFTPIVYYDQTPLRWQERKSAWASFAEERMVPTLGR